MININLYAGLLTLRFIAFIALSILQGYLFWQTDWIFTQIVLFIVLSLLVVDIHQQLHRTNRDLSRLLSALKHQDFEIHFNSKRRSARYQHVIAQMNEIKHQYQSIATQNAGQQQLHTQLLNWSATAVIVFNDAGIIVYQNEPFCHLFDTPPLTQASALEHFVPGIIERVGHLPAQSTILIQKSESNYHLNDDVHCRVNHIKQRGITLTILSLTPHTPSQNGLDYEAWINFGKVISHEILNGITPISTLADTLEKNADKIEDDALKQKMQKALALISERCISMQQFAEKYRTLNRLPELEKAQTSWNTILEQSLTPYHEQLKAAGIDLHLSGGELNAPVFADSTQLTHVFSNLLLNSIDALDTSGIKKIGIDVTGNNTHFLIRFKDTGKGINEEMLSRIFVPFFTTKENGSGIGLGIARQILWQHGAELFYEKTDLDETVFLIRFPRH